VRQDVYVCLQVRGAASVEGVDPEAAIAPAEHGEIAARLLIYRLDLGNGANGERGCERAALRTPLLAYRYAEAGTLAETVTQHFLVAVFEDIQRQELARKEDDVQREDRDIHPEVLRLLPSLEGLLSGFEVCALPGSQEAGGVVL